MLSRIIKFSIDQKIIIGIAVIGLIVWGTYSLTRLPIDAVPDITNNQVQVITQAPAFSAQDIERLVTFPIEQAMANLPHMVEMRSFSRFGLSVTTLVFDEEIDVYWARQQVSERLVQVKNELPPEMGSPDIAPVTTGLGEIFQYIIKPKKGFEHKYSLSELRTVQDWIVRRQMLGTKGVADVSSFGGYVKQYEVALNSERLKSLNVSVNEVFDAINKGNQNTGGAYIEKHPLVYFIRTDGMAKNEEDIKNILVRNLDNGLPLLVKDIAAVRIGNAVRYGAMTYNNDGEVVGGIVMMLKGENSSQVIRDVKTRIEEIQQNLPEGLEIMPYLDRTKLVNGAIKTVSTNLIEGALIVILVLVLMLGNFRAGLIVASVIPLAMLFAVSLMRVFGVSGNLMSLGAIDFGLIVDGAVIIVESTLHHLHKQNKGLLTQGDMDREVQTSAISIRNSAAFGEIIILIVYLPILTLTGIEGKMFKPMAQTVSFAIIGAFILSLTYVPMMSALFLQKKFSQEKSMSEKFIDWVYEKYKPILAHVIQYAKRYIAVSLLFFIGTLLLFSSLGAEFVPTLDEGDFAVETRVLTGSGISKTVEVSQKSAQVLLDHFPEVERVVGKIGTSEIPIDPMPMEASDLIVILKNKQEWTSATTRDELAAQMQQQLEDHLPGVTYGFQQPIQMRFNELMTGARQDVVVKIFGEDLSKLAVYAKEAGAIISKIEGAEDVFVEPITGISQIVIRPDRKKLAQYGMTMEEVNEAVYSALAGKKAGLVFEEERRFDLVVRFDTLSRKSIEQIRQMYIQSKKGTQVPLQQIAEVKFELSPNQIQRDAGKRRVIIGFNVRGRDVASIVDEVQQKMNKVSFAPGYHVTYGGAFKNLEEARVRLYIAVPVALALIFTLLYFTFYSFSLALLIFTAIPLSASGGILSLWLRDMPFSISAGIGFIALFGVAVLNGIVLVAEFTRIHKSGGTTDEILFEGTRNRLRPVLMTALVASLGFLPMALSNGDGAEVQKPLATVVIGGLLTSTLLTLFIIPILYKIILTRKMKTNILVVLLPVLLAASVSSHAQTVTMDQAVSIALSNNSELKMYELNAEAKKKQRNAYSNIPKTDINLTYGQYNSYERNDNNLSIAQGIPFSTFTGSNKAYGNALYTQSQFQLSNAKKELIRNVQETYIVLNYLTMLNKKLQTQDTLYERLLYAAKQRMDAGDIKPMEYGSISAQRVEIKSMLLQNESKIKSAYSQLYFLLQSDINYKMADTALLKLQDVLVNDSISLESHPLLLCTRQQIEVAEKQKKAEVSKALPDLKLGYFNQTLIGYHNVTGTDIYYGPDSRFQGVQVGLSLPIWFVPENARIKGAELEKKKSETAYRQFKLQLNTRYQQAKQKHDELKNLIAFYETTSMDVARMMHVQAQKSYMAGDISYSEFLLASQRALQLEMTYMQSIYDYNQIIIELTYLMTN
jgi:cobalt-zinc-cadmium resistance protein CzcA